MLLKCAFILLKIPILMFTVLGRRICSYQEYCYRNRQISLLSVDQSWRWGTEKTTLVDAQSRREAQLRVIFRWDRPGRVKLVFLEVSRLQQAGQSHFPDRLHIT